MPCKHVVLEQTAALEAELAANQAEAKATAQVYEAIRERMLALQAELTNMSEEEKASDKMVEIQKKFKLVFERLQEGTNMMRFVKVLGEQTKLYLWVTKALNALPESGSEQDNWE